MNDEAERIYAAARELDPTLRSTYLADQCAGNQSLLEELTSLLEHSEDAENFFSSMGAQVLPAMAADAVIGRAIGHYRILAHIDEGGMGSVYRAVDTRLDREVALKILPATNATNALKEAKHAAALRHPNICVVHDIGATDDGRPFIAMELCEGQTLSERLTRGPLDTGEFLNVAVQIANGLNAAHSRGIIHGDLKPANVIVGHDGMVKLLDFGLARKTDAHSGAHGLRGTLPYMSPEQVAGASASQRTDLWALGVVFYEMITGSRPFHGGDDAVIQSILHDIPQSIAALAPETPSRLQSTITRLLAKNPADRYPNVGAVLRDVSWNEHRPPARAHRNRAALFSTLVIFAALITLGVSSWRGKNANASQNVREQRRLTKNIAAYELYNRGRDPTLFRTDSGPIRGLALLKQAVALDSTFAGAYAAMTYLYWVLARPGNPDSVRTLQRLAESAARKSIALSPSLPEAWMGLGMAKSVGMEDLIGAEAAMSRAIELGGAPRAHEHLGQIFLWRGKIARAVNELQKATDEDPLSATASAELGHALCLANRPDEGLAMLDRLRNLEPPLRRIPGYRGECYIMQSRWDDAITAVKEERAALLGAGLIGFSLARSGNREDAMRMRADLERTWASTGGGALDAAMISAGLGDKTEFFNWLDRAAQSAWLSGTITSPYFSSMHADPRFAEFRRRHNF